ncbi:Uncharacterised protein [Acinetobacter haemolyticus]|nr:hypothetical protein HMPREF0023_2691 [Acinetobacter sp. ATCC 27244]ENW22391.1 hypothetical protein F926_00410 [Acinetobacter haemolyticus NIPH 261]SUU10704.1 Uncharacterised protein [Acinetobacter haemolyticus]
MHRSPQQIKGKLMQNLHQFYFLTKKLAHQYSRYIYVKWLKSKLKNND